MGKQVKLVPLPPWGMYKDAKLYPELDDDDKVVKGFIFHVFCRQSFCRGCSSPADGTWYRRAQAKVIHDQCILRFEVLVMTTSSIRSI